MNARLSTIAPDLVERLAQRPPHELRRIAEDVAEAAIEGTEVQDVRAKDALTALRADSVGETEEREAAKRLTEELDQIAWDIQDRVEAGEAQEADYLAAFRRARAAMSLWFALDPDPMDAALESVYEARAALGDDAVRDLIAAAS